MARRDRGATDVRSDEEAERGEGGGLALDTESPLPPTGPHDSDDLDPEVTDAAGLVDFGSIRVPVPPDGAVTVEPTANGRMQAVHIALPEGRLSVSALAAPKTSKLWPELAGEIDASLRESGARVRSFPGHWGRELHATSGGATSVFVGVDGARWMLYGVATGPSAHAAPLDAELRRLLRGTVVVRGKQPYPVRTILPLTVPDHLEAEAEATPAVTATGSKKRSPAKSGAGKSAPGKAAPGNTAPPNSDATTAAAKKAAARRAAARKAAAAAAVKAAAEALAEQAAEDRAAAGEHPDTRSATRNGAHPASGTIPSGPGPDAPLREQAPSARRAAAAAWRTRPTAPGNEDASPTEALPVARPVGDPPVTEAFPAAPSAEAMPLTEGMPPTEALRLVEPGSGGRRRLGEPLSAPPGGRRRLQEPPFEEPHPGGQLREPTPDMPPDRSPRDPEIAAGGRRRLPEPNDALGATAPWDLNEPGGRRRLHEPVADSGVSASGRRRLREPWDEAERGAGQQPERSNGSRRPAEPSGAPDTGVSASGRRRLRESWEPSEPVAETGVSASGRRRLREPRDEAGPGAGSRPWEPAPGGLNGSGGRRRFDESPPGADPRDAGPAPGAAVGDTGVSASGRRRLREPSDEAGPLDARAGSNGSVAETGVSASGRRRLREPRDEAGPGAGSRPWEPAPDGLNGSGGRRRLDESPAASGRRRLRESWDEAGPDAGRNGTGEPEAGGRRRRDPLGEPGQTGAADTGVSASGRRRLREPWESAGPAADTGVSASGRRRLQEPWDEGAPGPDGLNGSDGRLRSGAPEPLEPTGRRRRAMDAGEDPISGTGGRRRLREPEPAPARDGSQTEPWLVGPGSPGSPASPPDRSARRTLSAEYLIDTGEQDAGWAAALDDHAERRDGGRHSGADDGSPPTVRLETLLSELDPNRPRRRHRR